MPSDPQCLSELLPLCDVLVPNRSELGRLVGAPTPPSAEAVDACAERLDFIGELVVTLGADGAVVYRRGHRTPIPPVAVPAVDTSGAGDVFCGVLAHRLAAGDDLIDAAGAANRAAARSATIPGAQVPPHFTG
jgi:ribokinase